METMHRIRAGLIIVPVVPWEGAPRRQGPRSTAKFLPGCFDVFRVGLNVTTTKVVNFWGKKSAPWEKIPATPMSWRKMREGPRLTLVWGPRMVNPALHRIRTLCDLPFWNKSFQWWTNVDLVISASFCLLTVYNFVSLYWNNISAKYTLVRLSDVAQTYFRSWIMACAAHYICDVWWPRLLIQLKWPPKTPNGKVRYTFRIKPASVLTNFLQSFFHELLQAQYRRTHRQTYTYKETTRSLLPLVAACNFVLLLILLVK